MLCWPKSGIGHACARCPELAAQLTHSMDTSRHDALPYWPHTMLLFFARIVRRPRRIVDAECGKTRVERGSDEGAGAGAGVGVAVAAGRGAGAGAAARAD